MIKKEMKPALDALKTVKMSKIEDKSLRNLIIRDHLKLLGEQRKYEAAIEDKRTVFLDSWKEDQEAVEKLNDSLRVESDPKKQKELVAEINKYSDYLNAVKEFNDEAVLMGKEEVEIEPIDMDAFVAEYQKQDYEMGVVEAIYPMFG